MKEIKEKREKSTKWAYEWQVWRILYFTNLCAKTLKPEQEEAKVVVFYSKYSNSLTSTHLNPIRYVHIFIFYIIIYFVMYYLDNMLYIIHV